MASIPHATYRWDHKLECSFPYDKGLIEAIKIHIPASSREWDPARKVWIVESVYATTALRLMRDTFGDVIFDDQRFTNREPTPPTSKPQVDPAFATLYVLPDAPAFIIDAAFRALCKEYHPDRAPAHERDRAHELMVRINSAYESIRDRVAS